MQKRKEMNFTEYTQSLIAQRQKNLKFYEEQQETYQETYQEAHNLFSAYDVKAAQERDVIKLLQDVLSKYASTSNVAHEPAKEPEPEFIPFTLEKWQEMGSRSEDVVWEHDKSKIEFCKFYNNGVLTVVDMHSECYNFYAPMYDRLQLRNPDYTNPPLTC